MRKLGFGILARIIAAFCLASAVASPAQTFTTLFRFDGTHGQDAVGSLVQGTDGNFYGTTANGGASSKYCPFDGCGTVFKITPAGKLTVVYSFCRKANCADGDLPNGALLQGTNGSFYGAAAFGGTSSYCKQVFQSGYGCGTIFEITPTGERRTLYNFCSQKKCADGALPNGSLVLGRNGNLYGTAQSAGKYCVSENYDANGCGTVFEITPAGKLTTLYSFCAHMRSNGACPDGNSPLSGLVLATNGNFYGTTYVGGICYGGSSCGTVFEITPAGKLTTLHTFCKQGGCADGLWPYAGLIQATNGKFYGTASNGGGAFNNPGTIFEITAAGKLTVLYRFCTQANCKDGANPFAGLVQGTDGNFFGVATFGGTSGDCTYQYGCGTIFKVNPAGDLTTLYNFCSQSNCRDGWIPNQTLLQGTDGSFYGTTHQGGLATCRSGVGCGTIFRLSVGLAPFVQANPGFGQAGAVVDILGNNLIGTTKATFNGTPATFTVVSSTELKTIVPTGATTGKIKVTTPERILVSNVAFRVTK
jgi:uncharacterized repeat protein (TIGR03803 family)